MTRRGEPITESAIVEELRIHRRPVLVVGPLGAGKSHLIRRLAETVRDDTAAPQHVVQVSRDAMGLPAMIASFGTALPTQAITPTAVLDALAIAVAGDLPNGRPLTADELELKALLPAFLRDAALSDWLTTTATVVERLTAHVAGTRPIADSDTMHWRPEHVEVPPEVYRRIGPEARELAGLLMADPTYRPAVATLLTEAWTVAAEQLLPFPPADFNIGPESIVFIENLSTAYGLERALLTALAEVRSLIGVTPEALAALPAPRRGDAVVLEPLDTETQARLTAVALNSARGADTASFCLTSACPNRLACHAAFGAADDIGFYPLSRSALEQLAGPRPTPATVLDVVERVLTAAERDLPMGRFPAEAFGSPRVPDRVRRRLEEHHPESANRLRWALELYAPEAEDLPPGIGPALGLPGQPLPGEKLEPSVNVVSPPPIETEPVSPTAAVVASSESPRVVPPPADEFARWADGEPVEFRDLNRWRALVWAAISPAFADMAEQVAPTVIHFEGQLAGMTGEVQLIIPRSARAAATLRALPQANASDDIHDMVAGWIAELRRQCPTPVAAEPSAPTVTDEQRLACAEWLTEVTARAGSRDVREALKAAEPVLPSELASRVRRLLKRAVKTAVEAAAAVADGQPAECDEALMAEILAVLRDAGTALDAAAVEWQRVTEEHTARDAAEADELLRELIAHLDEWSGGSVDVA